MIARIKHRERESKMTTSAMKRTNEFTRLVRTHKDFDRLIEQLRRLSQSMYSGRRYMAESGSNAQLGRAYLTRIDQKYQTTLGRLNDLRREALELLAGINRPVTVPAA